VDFALSAANTLGVAAHWKKDIHREHNAGEPIRRFEDVTTSFALEDSHRLSPLLTLVAGAGHDSRDTREAQDYNSTTTAVSEFAHGEGSTNNAQLALLITPSSAWQTRLRSRRRTRSSGCSSCGACRTMRCPTCRHRARAAWTCTGRPRRAPTPR
jgi:iron complex outermembrane receptor protein